MPRPRKHEEGYAKSPERKAYKIQYRKDHYARLAVDITPEFLEELDRFAKEKGLSRARLVTEAVTAYMEAASESRRKEMK